jgi:hypothetical protein
MEILPHNIAEVSLIPEFINEIYITMIPGATCLETIEAAQKIQAVGKQASSTYCRTQFYRSGRPGRVSFRTGGSRN